MYGINNAVNSSFEDRVSEFAYQYVYGSAKNKLATVLGQLNLTYRKGKTKEDILLAGKSAFCRGASNDAMNSFIIKLGRDVLKSAR